MMLPAWPRSFLAGNLLLSQLVVVLVRAQAFNASEGGIPPWALAESPEEYNRLFVAADEEPDYLCSRTKPCKLGCCGPL